MNRKFKKNLPNILTFCNMAIGLSVIYTMAQNSSEETRQLSCYLILFGGIIDMLDGRLARRFHVESHMGKQLDSFADLITFGIAPIAIFFAAAKVDKMIVYIIFSLFPMAGAFRLARYNLEENNGYFTGLPITVAGGILTLMYLAYGYLRDEVISTGFLSFIHVLIIILSLLMVSRFKVKRILPEKKISQNRPL